MTSPYLFTEFIESGFEEYQSPFLTPQAKRWSKNLSLKSALFSAFLLALSFGLSFLPQGFYISRLLLLFVYFLAGIPSLIGAIRDLKHLELNIDILMTLAAFLSAIIGSEMEGGLLLVLFAISGAIEDSVTSRAKSSISELRALAPMQASCLNADGSVTDRSVKDITKGMHILVKAGQIVPLDGIVISGESSLNLVHLTGENLPSPKTINDTAPAGARNLDGVLILEVTHTSQESSIARLIDLICQAQDAKPRLQRWMDRFSHIYATSIILLACLFAGTFPFLFNIPFLGVEGGLYRALAFLIAASPCALILALPIAYLSSVSNCAKHGILLKGGIVLDALNQCRAIAFDKTGTLTTGNLTCISFENLSANGTRHAALAICHGLEKNAVHPVARALCKYAEQEHVAPASIEQFRFLSGRGVCGMSDGWEVYLGKPDISSIELPPSAHKIMETTIAEAHEKGQLVSMLIMKHQGESQVWLMRFEDTIRPKMRNMIEELQKRFFLVMLTGDHQVSAQRVADAIGLKHYYANLTPEEKLTKVSELTDREGLVMIGDGINDAPALTRATVGISMGKVGSTTAMDASDAILLHDNLEAIHWLFGQASKTRRILFENVTVALAAIVFASIPALLGWVPLWLAVIMHEGGTVIVGLNSLRLLKEPF